MSTNLYVADYIRRAIASDTIEPPDISRAGRHIEVLESIYTGHKMGGANTAETAWQTAARMRPEVASMFSVLKHIYNSLDLHKIPRLAYLLDEYPIYEASQNLLVGPRGTGKSFIAVDVACRVAQSDNVLYIAAEGVPFYDPRILAWHDHHQKQNRGNLLMYGDAVSHEPKEFEPFYEWVTREIKPVLVIVDTVARCIAKGGGNENDATEMGKFVETWERFKKKGASLLMVHHTNKGGTQRGSNALDGAADSVLMLHPHEAGFSLRNDYAGGGKNRGRAQSDTMYFKIEGHAVGKYDSDEAAVALPVERKEVHIDEVGETLTENQMLIMELVSDSGGMLPKDIQESLPTIPRSTCFRTINTMVNAELLTKSGASVSVSDKGKRIYESQ